MVVSNTSENPEYKIIIIGAGMAGLSAAQHLADLGHTDILVLEAKNRVGGRIHTLKTNDGFPIEMGANTLLHVGTRERPNPLIPLLKECNLTTVSIDPIDSTQFKANDYFEDAVKAIRAAKEAPWQTMPSLGEILKIPPLKSHLPLHANGPEFIAKQTMTHLIQTQMGSLPQDVSLLELMNAEPDFNTDETFIFGGYQQLPENIAKKAMATGHVKILLNAPVKTVHYSDNNLTPYVITAHGEKYTATCILCAVPPGVLQHRGIRFVPELSPEKQQLIQDLKIGFHNKVILEFKKVFWPKEAQFFFPGSPNYHYFPEYLNLFYFSKQQIPALVCHFYGSNACFQDETDDHIVEKALLPLQAAYGKTAVGLKDASVTRWDSDPYTLGSRACYGLHSKHLQRKNFEKSEKGNLFFAGAHTLANQDRETVQGAYTSGVRVALDINQRLKFKTKRNASL